MPWTEIGYAAVVGLIATLIVCAEMLQTFGEREKVSCKIDAWSETADSCR
jgi:hypothetical protein